MKRAAGLAFLGALLLAGGGHAWLAGVRASAPPPPEVALSVEVLDREGRLLRPFALADGRWRLKADLRDVDRRYVDMLLAYEDKRFWQHGGVDPLALLRAAGQMALHGRIVSGGSTLTMQVARLLEPREGGGFAARLRAKLAEMRRAIQLEARLSKREILALYLVLAPYGGNIEGVRAASLGYFGKEPRRLSLAEAALLVALPQAPESRRPDRNPDRAARGRATVLARLEAAGLFGAAERDFALRAPIPARRLALPMHAAHAAEAARRERPAAHEHRLALDASAQVRLEALAGERVRELGKGVSLALVMVDNASGEVLARVSGADPLDPERAGAVDLTRATRSPGSTLKPFIYGLAFEDGIAHPETLIEDRPARFGAYRPRNFDRDYQGTVSVRQALQLSLNVPAVVLLQAVGPQRLASRLGQSGFALTLPPGEVPGLAVGLGGVGMSLDALAGLYAGLANGGEAHALRDRLDGGVSQAEGARRLVSPVSAAYLAQALAGTPAPRNERAGRIAFKTGTSFGYRDAWAVGFDGRRTIAVWVGRPDGQPVPGMIGREAAAPILFEAFARLVNQPAPFAPAPREALAVRNVELPPPLRHFGRRAGAGNGGEGPKIAFPPDGASLDREGDEPLALKVSGGAGPLTVFVDGVPAGEPARAATMFWRPAGAGFVRLTVMDAAGLSDSVTLRIHGAADKGEATRSGRLSGR
ncbi:penicillin-binding protein 1C [Ancylobacter dichloromethanicus]|uniref:peptidoglycan glycosyltransferase n=1 Tax=Ancylobacter dichloromethanicus TaxID=518825 RepID=A0A9W6J6Z3_9HYPH|nr:penicillin-binding protein 1C [Ancylobacter dichloromethanicus]GLK70385.1 penicillin-binding protein 1C [Ancylobacter dichloromethanicus]